MCIQHHQNFHFNCGHVQDIFIPSIDPQCQKRKYSMYYHLAEPDNPQQGWCPRCLWTQFVIPKSYQETGLALPCGGLTGEVIRTIAMDPAQFKCITTDDLWLKRDEWLDKRENFREDQLVELLAAKTDEEHAAGVGVLDRTYLISRTYRDDEFLKPVSPKDVEQGVVCLCGGELGVRGQDGCNLTFSCKLPCGHIGGYDCFLGWFETQRKNTCPSCRAKYEILREDLPYFPPGYQERRTAEFQPTREQKMQNLKNWFIQTGIYYLMVFIVGLFVSPPPWMSWTNLFLYSVGCYVYLTWRLRWGIGKINWIRFSVSGNGVEFLFALCFGGENIWKHVILGFLLAMYPLYLTSFGGQLRGV